DTIIFNPPYLPTDEEIAKYAADIAVDGGPTGLDVITRFITEAKDFLSEGGAILIVASDHTDLAFLERFALENGYSIRAINHRKLDFETLYVYKLELMQDA
ncbi:protoporphyrinogen oxidase, partial [Candidatus Woesearchaeota archaeon]